LRIIVAPDSFKGSLTSPQACRAIERGFRAAWPDAEIISSPMADGGEGTVQALVSATGGRLCAATVHGPLGHAVTATYGILGDGETCAIEMAAASGLPLVPMDLRDPKVTCTYGTGELIRAGLDDGCRAFIIGIGGSATNDGGAGAARALGARLLDTEGRPLPPGGAALARLDRIDTSGLDPRVREARFTVACDVTNPLCGDQGASAIYGPQKGATPEDIAVLDAAIAHYADVLEAQLGIATCDLPGAGAAGGLGGGLVAFLGAELRRGVDLVIEATGLARATEFADLVVTGEGRIDSQTAFGKTVSGVAAVAGRFGVPVVAFAGSVAITPYEAAQAGLVAVEPIATGPISESEAMAHAGELLSAAAERVGRLLRLGELTGRRSA